MYTRHLYQLLLLKSTAFQNDREDILAAKVARSSMPVTVFGIEIFQRRK